MIWPRIPPEVNPALYYACVGISVLFIGISKAGFGGGTGILAIPLMAAVMPAPRMLGILLPLLIAADILSNLHHLGAYAWRLLRPMLAGAVLGITAGTVVLWLLRRSDPESFQNGLALLVGSICLVFVVVQLYGLTGRKVPTLPPHPASSAAVGGLAGLVSTLSHSAGPIATLYLLQQKVEKRLMVGSLVLFFLLVNIAKVPTFVVQGYINVETLRDSVWFIPLIPLGTLAGAWMNRRIPEKPFAVILYIAAAGTAGHMIYTAL